MSETLWLPCLSSYVNKLLITYSFVDDTLSATWTPTLMSLFLFSSETTWDPRIVNHLFVIILKFINFQFMINFLFSQYCLTCPNDVCHRGSFTVKSTRDFLTYLTSKFLGEGKFSLCPILSDFVEKIIRDIKNFKYHTYIFIPSSLYCMTSLSFICGFYCLFICLIFCSFIRFSVWLFFSIKSSVFSWNFLRWS